MREKQSYFVNKLV